MKIGHSWPRRVAVLLALTVAAFTAAGVSPAAAGEAHALAGTYCDPLASNQFNSLSALQPGSTARGTTLLRDRETRGIADSTELPSGTEPDTSGFKATIPVYFHVVTSGKLGQVTNAQIRQQMDVLNLSFGGFYGGVDTGFRFALKGVTRTDNAGWFAQETFAQEVEMKTALKRGDAKTLNIYSTSGGGYLGWAYYPSIVTQPQYQVLDGVLIHYGSVPGGFIEGFNLGYTATHEVGHWLALAHTFSQGCTGHGDYVEDTPAEATPTSGCPEGKDTCTAPGHDPIHNYMDYSDDPCYNQFTAGQSERAQAQYLHWRVKVGYTAS